MVCLLILERAFHLHLGADGMPSYFGTEEESDKNLKLICAAWTSMVLWVFFCSGFIFSC